jgi:hypothetical protein
VEEEQPQSSRQKWEHLNVQPVDMPVESYGNCSRKSCKNIEVLGNGLCEQCWDKGYRPPKDLPIIKDSKDDSATWELLEYLMDKSEGAS